MDPEAVRPPLPGAAPAGGTPLPSLGPVLAAAAATLRRFPLVLLAAAAAAVAASLTNDALGPLGLRDPLLAAATLGLPLLTAATLAGEGRRAPLRLGAPLAALAALAAVWAAWPGWTDQVRLLRYLQLSAGFHLLAALAPFAGRDRPHAFWQFNRVLLTRFLAAGLSSLVLFAGLGVALAALDKLFGVDVPIEGYARLFYVIAFVPTTWSFLGGIPDDLARLEARRDYPAGLRVFAQYTLVPLVSVYLLILTAYLLKVVITWDWPSGWIGWLVSGVAAAGILALLLVHPIAEREDQRWVRIFARDFWLAILPAVVMLWLALYQRVRQYGFTEPRVWLLVLSLWLFGLAVYYTLTRSTRIRAIPLTLCLVVLSSYAGPWSAWAVAGRSQAARLAGLLQRAGLVREGRLAPPTGARRPDPDGEVTAVVRYLLATGCGERLAALVGDSLLPGGRGGGEPAVRRVVAALGVTYTENRRSGGSEFFAFEGSAADAVPLAGFDVLLRIRPRGDSAAGADALWASLEPGRAAVRIARGTETLAIVPLDSLLRTLPGGVRVGRTRAPEATLAWESGGLRGMVRLRRAIGTRSDRRVDAQTLEGDVLVRLGR